MKTKKIKKNGNSWCNANASVCDILRLMDSLHLSISLDVYAYLIKECTKLKDAESGSQVYFHMTRNGHQPTLLLANRLLLMYVSCGRLDSAHQLFDKMILKDSITWVTMIAGHFDNGEYVETLTLFKQMQEQCGLLEESMWGLIIDCVLRACIQTVDFGLGKQVHGLVLKMDKKIFNKGGGCSNDLFLGSLLISFYGKLGSIRSARCIFDKLELRDTVVWTNMIVVYSKEEHFKEVLETFKEMGRAGTKKNTFTLSSVIRACGRMGDEGSGKQVHCNAIKLGIESDQFVRCSLVDMYGKCGMVKDARRLFEMARGYEKRTNDVCWNAMLTGYTQNGFYNEAIKFLYKMQSNGVQPPESLLNQSNRAVEKQSSIKKQSPEEELDISWEFLLPYQFRRKRNWNIIRWSFMAYNLLMHRLHSERALSSPLPFPTITTFPKLDLIQLTFEFLKLLLFPIKWISAQMKVPCMTLCLSITEIGP
ncbi:hypothetical protein AQUCO_05300002v1 [Aquilegia coerulea]|uniref:Pentacotripeptide-repeat region of PRORP domain-containing protein n=1 Tax=Aquilegia coerulea TaxID=218851 RepID=A0A2G5CHY5_AQUCA|nr:hypothetical protein AQUCO_05300002v1 [Aquilegia coerulea]